MTGGPERETRIAVSIARERIRRILELEIRTGQEKLSDANETQTYSATKRKFLKDGNLAHQVSLVKERVDHLYQGLDSNGTRKVREYFQFLGRMKDGHFLVSSGRNEHNIACPTQILCSSNGDKGSSPSNKRSVISSSEKPTKRTRRSKRERRSAAARVRRSRQRLERCLEKSKITIPSIDPSFTNRIPSRLLDRERVAGVSPNGKIKSFSRMRNREGTESPFMCKR